MVCNQCGDCCDGSRPGVLTDDRTGLPRIVWGSEFPADRYASRFGQPLLIPLVRGDGQLVDGDDFERDDAGVPYTSFRCPMLAETGDPLAPTRCSIWGGRNHLLEKRPLNCGDFPVFGLVVDDSIIAHGSFVPPTGGLPNCTWHGIRIVGPWKEPREGIPHGDL